MSTTRIPRQPPCRCCFSNLGVSTLTPFSYMSTTQDHRSRMCASDRLQIRLDVRVKSGGVLADDTAPNWRFCVSLRRIFGLGLCSRIASANVSSCGRLADNARSAQCDLWPDVPDYGLHLISPSGGLCERWLTWNLPPKARARLASSPRSNAHAQIPCAAAAAIALAAASPWKRGRIVPAGHRPAVRETRAAA